MYNYGNYNVVEVIIGVFKIFFSQLLGVDHRADDICLIWVEEENKKWDLKGKIMTYFGSKYWKCLFKPVHYFLCECSASSLSCAATSRNMGI